MKIVVAGGSGGLGRRVCADLGSRGHDIAVLTREAHEGFAYRQVEWDGKTVGSWADELSGAAVINLCGAIVDRAPTSANISLLTRSRVEPTTALVQEAEDLSDPPVAWIQMSTLAIYGDAGDAVLDESARPADGPAQMPGVARPWEQAAAGARTTRMVILRTGIVLDPLTHRPAAPPTPTWLLRLGAFVMGSDPALALTGRRCVPGALERAGFEFAYPELGAALRDLLGPVLA